MSWRWVETGNKALKKKEGTEESKGIKVEGHMGTGANDIPTGRRDPPQRPES